MAKTFSCTGENCPIHDGGAVRCTATNCEDRTPYDPNEFFGAERKMTNADRIRSLSDKELTEWIVGMHYSYCCPNEGAHDCKPTCRACWLDWLKQEVDT